MRWNILLFSQKPADTDLESKYPKVSKYCELVPTQNVEETIEHFLYLQSEIVIVCSDVAEHDLKKLKKVLHQINSNLVIIENFDFLKYNIFDEIKKAIELYNTSNSDLFQTKFSPN